MIRLAIFSFLILLLFGNCHKEGADMKVTYKVRETSANTPQYTVSYTSDVSGTSTSTTSSLDEWNSASLILKRGEFVSMTLDCNAPAYDFIIDIFVDGGFFREAELHNPNTSATISGTLGN